MSPHGFKVDREMVMAAARATKQEHIDTPGANTIVDLDVLAKRMYGTSDPGTRAIAQSVMRKPAFRKVLESDYIAIPIAQGYLTAKASGIIFQDVDEVIDHGAVAGPGRPVVGTVVLDDADAEAYFLMEAMDKRDKRVHRGYGERIYGANGTNVRAVDTGIASPAQLQATTQAVEDEFAKKHPGTPNLAPGVRATKHIAAGAKP